MKDQFLKLAGVKTEEEFYRLFPNTRKGEEKFMAKYGKQVNKILRDGGIVKAQGGWQDTIAPNPLQMETYDFVGNQKAIDKSANKVRRQNLRQGVGLNSNEGLMDESINNNNFSQNFTNSFSNVKPKDIETGVAYGSAAFGGIDTIGRAVAAKKKEKNTNISLQALKPLIAQAASSSREPIERQYLRPDDPDYLIQPDTLHNPLGSGQGLYAKNGGEITNTYAPNTLYKDLEQADSGLIIEGIKTAGDLGAFVFDIGAKKYQKKNEQLMGQMGMQPGIQNLQSPYVSHMERGGFLNPQISSELEGIPMNKLFAPDPYMDTLRMGGNVRQNNITAMDGKMRATWGGSFEPIAQSSSLPGSGQMVKINGNLHDERDPKTGQTGVGISVGNTGENPLQQYAEYGTKSAIEKSNVEAQRGEPAIEQMNPDGTMSIVIHGGQKLTKLTAEAIGDPKRAGQKIQNVSLDYGGKIATAKKKMDNSIMQLGELKVTNSFDKLRENSLIANSKGNKMKQDGYADKLVALTAAQEWINETEKSGVNPKSLDKGVLEKIDIEKAKNGVKIKSAKEGATISQEEYDEALKLYNSGKIKEFQQLGMKLMPDYIKSLGVANKFDDGKDGKNTKTLLKQLKNSSRDPLPDMSNFKIDDLELPNYGSTNDSVNTALEYFKTRNATPVEENYPEIKSKTDRFGIARDIYNQVRPYIIPSNAEGLALEQIAPELLAMQDQIEPVRAQKVPLRTMPMQNISFDREREDLTSDYRAMQRLAPYNQALLSNLAAGKYTANREIADAEFKANQESFRNTLGYNLEAMNKNDLANLGLLDDQYVRQQQAIANTKAVRQAALNSINAKILENRLANRQLQIAENTYDFRFNDRGRAINVNPLQQFNTNMMGNVTLAQLEEEVNRRKKEQKETKPENARNGSILKAFRS